MDLIEIYQCLCDATRLRILHLLTRGPLCVCHFQDILNVPQTKVSQHLSYLRKRGLVEVTRHANWMIYRLPARPARELEANLKCLQDCAAEDKRFRADLKKLAKIQSGCGWIAAALKDEKSCCP
ncbi:MAG: ArsR/SmtB family transcription factor [Terrimicrobiaceae bacterium]